jgi:hypothetical protein
MATIELMPIFQNLCGSSEERRVCRQKEFVQIAVKRRDKSIDGTHSVQNRDSRVVAIFALAMKPSLFFRMGIGLAYRSSKWATDRFCSL